MLIFCVKDKSKIIFQVLAKCGLKCVEHCFCLHGVAQKCNSGWKRKFQKMVQNYCVLLYSTPKLQCPCWICLRAEYKNDTSLIFGRKFNLFWIDPRPYTLLTTSFPAFHFMGRKAQHYVWIVWKSFSLAERTPCKLRITCVEICKPHCY